VAEAGLSTGAVYGRFGSKNALLQEAVVRRAASDVNLEVTGLETVVQTLLGFGPLTDDEAVRLGCGGGPRRGDSARLTRRYQAFTPAPTSP
jgi:AcrR family transcriptional regulator